MVSDVESTYYVAARSLHANRHHKHNISQQQQLSVDFSQLSMTDNQTRPFETSNNFGSNNATTVVHQMNGEYLVANNSEQRKLNSKMYDLARECPAEFARLIREHLEALLKHHALPVVLNENVNVRQKPGVVPKCAWTNHSKEVDTKEEETEEAAAENMSHAQYHHSYVPPLDPADTHQFIMPEPPFHHYKPTFKSVEVR